MRSMSRKDDQSDWEEAIGNILVSLILLLIMNLLRIRRDTCPVTKRKRFILIKWGSDHTVRNIIEFYKITSEREILSMLDDDSSRANSILDRVVQNMCRVFKQPLPQRRYLDAGMKWEVLVDAEPKFRFFSLDSICKIIIHQDVLWCLQTDGKIAFLIGRMVARVCAQYSYEILAQKVLSISIMLMVIVYVIFSSPPLMFLVVFLLGPFCILAKLLQIAVHRIEMEADYIGMLLSASAGYDPREAPEALMEMELEYIRWMSYPWRFFFPPSKDRINALVGSKMEEALALYNNIQEEN